MVEMIIGNARRKTRRFAPLLAALASLVLIPPTFAQSVSPVTGEDMILGSPKARVTVIEYASASCTHCATFNNDIFPAFKAKYIDTGKVRYVLREFVTQPQALAIAVFLTARCAGKDKYFSVLDAAFHAQKHIYETGELRDPLVQIAKDAGLNEDKLTACLNDDAKAAALDNRVKSYVENDKIESTPTFVIGEDRLVGVKPLEALDAAIAKATPPHRKHKP
jgi:protein-disulfide isomerase